MKDAMRALALITIIGVCGCATTGGGGATDEEQIMQQLTVWSNALQNDDVDTAMAVYSEDVVGFEGSDKEGLTAFFHGASESGDLANIDFIIGDATVTVDGTSAEASPVVIAGDFGEFEMVFLMEKEDGTWRIIGQDGLD